MFSFLFYIHTQTATCQAPETFAHVALAIASAEVVVDTCQLILFRRLVYYAKYVVTLFSIYCYISITVLSLTESFPIATMCNKHLYCGCSPVGVDATTRHNRDRLWVVSYYTNNK